MKVYVNGEWMDDSQATISIFDIAVLRGFGIFDFLRTYKQVPFRLGPHLDRLFHSARLMEMTVPKTKEEIDAIIQKGIKLNSKNAEDFNIRIVVTGGVSPDSISIGTPSLIVIYTQAKDYPAEYYTKGIKVTTFPVMRLNPGAKSLNYMAGVLELKKAREKGATEIIHTDPDGTIREGMTSNFMVVINGEIVTPKDTILQGITKKVVKEIAEKKGIAYIERNLNMSELSSFEEAFVTASNKEIMPVNQIDDHVIGNGEPGQVTKKLIETYRKMARV